ncbi:MAG: amidase family protein, partial [Acidimicrobiales bacterium]
MSELHERPALELAAAIRGGEVASREVVDHLLDRVERLNGPINAVVTVDAERARVAAKRADDATVRGDDLGPLHGVPITVKDSFSTAGMRTTSGAPMLADYVPVADAAPVAALRAAGCIVFGKTNLPMFAGDMQTYNEVFGVTNNPYDLDRSPGGSSGGAAAALACGFTPLELGSDIGGSIRIPAHACGVVGHKPSHGIVPAQGHIPGPPGSLSVPDLFVAGPMARSVADLVIALGLISGPDLFAADAWELSLPPPPDRPIRLAVWFDDPAASVTGETVGLLEAAAAGLAGQGFIVDAEARPETSLEEAFTLFETLLQAVLGAGNQTAELDEWADLSGNDPFSVQRRRR